MSISLSQSSLFVDTIVSLFIINYCIVSQNYNRPSLFTQFFTHVIPNVGHFCFTSRLCRFFCLYLRDRWKYSFRVQIRNISIISDNQVDIIIIFYFLIYWFYRKFFNFNGMKRNRFWCNISSVYPPLHTTKISEKFKIVRENFLLVVYKIERKNI